jgi:hypothetical protein
MALDPRISLAAHAPPYIPVPDVGQAMLTAEQINAMQQMAQQRQLTLAEMLRQRQN